eukprot:TRINITY_DN3652_c0_g1_i7.p1 TRINITY_DN3652_c0_g1~~TRINITY_DN3652_c0_g1_i7.p1  ORF type:complete len:348 (-),score=32.04 TRINITY_DN3652_c0_g1_i7:99-1142(-)
MSTNLVCRNNNLPPLRELLENIQGNAFPEMSMVLERLNKEQKLSKLYHIFSSIYQCEEQFTLQAMNDIKEQNEQAYEGCDLSQEFHRNALLFKDNLTYLCQFLIEKIWETSAKSKVEQIHKESIGRSADYSSTRFSDSSPNRRVFTTSKKIEKSYQSPSTTRTKSREQPSPGDTIYSSPVLKIFEDKISFDRETIRQRLQSRSAYIEMNKVLRAPTPMVSSNYLQNIQNISSPNRSESSKKKSELISSELTERGCKFPKAKRVNPLTMSQAHSIGPGSYFPKEINIWKEAKTYSFKHAQKLCLFDELSKLRGDSPGPKYNPCKKFTSLAIKRRAVQGTSDKTSSGLL